jgi:hypothetical protein
MRMRSRFASIAGPRLFQPLAAFEIQDREAKEDDSHKDKNYVAHGFSSHILGALGLGSNEVYLRIL